MKSLFPVKFSIEETDMEAPAVERGLMRLWHGGQIQEYGNFIIEIGCNESRCAIELAKYNFVAAIDVNPFTITNYGDDEEYDEEVPDTLNFLQADASRVTPRNMVDGNESYFDIGIAISSIEHFGFGEYGDEIDEDSDVRAMSNMWGAIKKNGVVLVTVPISEEFGMENRYTRKYSKQALKDRIIQGNILQRFEIITGPHGPDFVGGAKAFETYDFSDIPYHADIYLEMIKRGNNESKACVSKTVC